MTTTIYQKFISRYADYFTLVEMSEGTNFCMAEIIPSAKVNKMSEDEVAELIEELSNWQNEKASWTDDVSEDEFIEQWSKIDTSRFPISENARKKIECGMREK